MGGTNTWSTVLDWFVGNGEFTQVVTDHFSADLDLVVGTARMDSDDASDHFGEDDHVSQVGLNASWLFQFLGVLLGGDKTLEKSTVFSLETTVQSSAWTSVQHLDEGSSEIKTK